MHLKKICTVLILLPLIHFTTAQTTVVPVVFHILHTGGSENISDAQVLDEIRILNRDYNKLNSDTVNISPLFLGIAASMDLTFRLANLDPYGNCTNGIEHIYSTLTNDADDVDKIHDWPRDKYLNIWVVRSIASGGAASFSFPWQIDTLPAVDGIMVLDNYVGSIGTSSSLVSRTLTQLTGKYLGLLNTSGLYSACGDDSVSDTPPASIYWAGCPTSDSAAAICNPPTVENYQNFMAGIYCGCMFTNGQKVRVDEWLNRSTAGRDNLWTSGNLSATGTTTGVQTACAPICDFTVNNNYICLGASVTFKDASYNGGITGRQWTFLNANLSTSNDSAVVITYTTAGWQTVTLTVTNAQGNSTKTQTLVYVANPNSIAAAPYYYSFEDSAGYSNWAAINPDNDIPAFQRSPMGSHTGLYSVLLNNYFATTDGSLDEFISPPLDLSTVSDTDAFNFWYACAARPGYGGKYYDSLVVSISDNCGNSWPVLYRASGADAGFITGGTVDGFYQPTVGDWKHVQVQIPTLFLNQTRVLFRFQMFGTHLSNNFYLDDFAIGNFPTSIYNATKQAISVAPNPFNSKILIRGLNDEKYVLSVTDLLGQEIINRPEFLAVNGTYSLELPVTTPPGVYLLKVFNTNFSAQQKIVKQ